MVDLLWKKRWLIWLTTVAFYCNRIKREKNIKRTMWKSTLESIMHSTWIECEYENLSLFLAKYTDVRDSTTCVHIYSLCAFKISYRKKTP